MVRRSFHRSAARVLALFVALIVVTGIAPWMNAHAYERVCSTQGDRWVDEHGHVQAASDSGTTEGHVAHCPLCMPAATPPSPFVLQTPSERPVATLAVRRHAARLASLAGAPFPPRAPPVLS